MVRTKIKKDPKKGRGVFADEYISKGDRIEVCQLLILNYNDICEGLEGYVYQYSATKVALALGNGSLYNHSERPNANFYFDTRKKVLILEAKRGIFPGEEISINYGYTRKMKEKFHIS